MRDRKRGKEAGTTPGSRHRRSWIILGVILIAAVALRVVFLTELTGKPDFDAPVSDAQYNDFWARGIATGQWDQPKGNPDPLIPSTPYFRPPGYPHFLALIYMMSGGSYLAPRIAQALLGLIGILLAFFLGRSVFGRATGLVAAAMAAAYWGLIYFEGELQPPALLVVLVLSLLLLLHRWAVRKTLLPVAVAGVVFGATALVRPNVLLLLPVLLGWFWWVAVRSGLKRRLPITAAAFVVCTVLVIAPASLRNLSVAGDFVPISSNGGINLYIGNNTHTSLVTPRIPDIERLAGVSGWNLFRYPLIVEGVAKHEGRAMKHSEVSGYFSERAVDFISANPGTALGYAFKRGLLLWGPNEVSNNKVLGEERRRSPVLRMLLTFPIVMALFVLGLGLWVLDWRRLRHL
ncbi:glycosyltransferase family 39 protein, partial [Candidatus Eisenbacteria bacterium]